MALNGYINIDVNIFASSHFQADRYSLRCNDGCVLKKNLARTKLFEFNYFKVLI